MEEIKRSCNTCEHSRIVKQDITKRICKGMPPQVVPVPTHGGIQLQFHWPMVEANDEGCGLHKPKKMIDTTIGNA